MYLEVGVDTTLFRCIFVVVSEATSVDVTSGYSRLSPHAVKRTRFISVLFGRMLATGLIYDACLPLDGLVWEMKKIVFVPVDIIVPTH